MATTQTSGSGDFALGPTTINDASNYVLIGIVQIDPKFRGKGASLLVHGDVGAAGAIAAFKLTWAAVVGGTHSDLVLDASFNTATDIIPSATNNLYQTAAAGAFKLMLGRLPAEIGFYAKKSSADTTVTLNGFVA